MEPTVHCKNCEEVFDASFNYCPTCGQKANDQLTIRVLFSNTISNYFSVDARFFKSVIPLLFKPGILARRFVDGKRQVYLHPAQYYLFISVIFFFLFSIVTRDHDEQVLSNGSNGDVFLGDTVKLKQTLQENDVEISDEDLKKLDSIKNQYYDQSKTFAFTDKKLDSLIEAGASDDVLIHQMGYEEKDGPMGKLLFSQALKIYKKRAGGLLKTFYDTIPISMFFMLPIFALILKIFYFKSGSFSHHMVFSFYYFTFIFLSLSLLMIIGFWLDLPDWLFGIYVFLVFIYLVIGLKYFYQKSWIKSIFKGSFVGMSYTLFVVPISFVIMIIISFLLY